MINILKKEIENFLGREITKKSDCEYLSDAIFDTLNSEISPSTLRRFYGLLPPTKPNIRTLNTLAQFLGYKHFYHFSKTYQYKEKISFTELIYAAIKENNDDLIIDVIEQYKSVPVDFLSVIITLVRELLHKERYRLIDRMFRLKSLEFSSFSYYEALRIGNSIGLLLQEKKEIDQRIFTNENFIDFVYMTFVDYSNLNNYYGHVSEIISKNNKRNDILLFSKSILEFRNFLNNKPYHYLSNSKGEKIHPILSGRLLALKLLASNSYENIGILKNYHIKIKDNRDKLDHYFELFTTSILMKNTDVMRFLIDNITVQFKFQHHKIHLNSFYLMCLYYYRLQGDVKNEKQFTAAFNLSNCLHSYKEFMHLLWLIYQYNKSSDNIEKKEIKKTYVQLGKTLKYAYFSEDYLQNYFMVTQKAEQ